MDKVRNLNLDVISWLTPIAAVLVAVGLDRWEEALKKAASTNFEFAPAVWGGLVANLVVTALLLLLAWLIAFRQGHIRGPAAICLCLGVLIAVYPWLFVIAWQEIPRFFMWPPLRDLRAILMAGGLSSRSALLSSFLVLVGLVGLLLPARRRSARV